MPKRLRIMPSCQAAVGLLFLFSVSCGGEAANNGGEDAFVVNGKISRRGSTPFSLLMLEARDGSTYLIKSSVVADELRQLEGLDVAVTCVKEPEMVEDLPVITALAYDLLPTASGNRPVIGYVNVSNDGAVYIVDDSDVVWIITGSFQPVLSTFAGAKVWVVGTVDVSIVDRSSSRRFLIVSEYGVIRP